MSAPNQAGQPKEDYLDKGLDAAEKKFGGQVCLLPPRCSRPTIALDKQSITIPASAP